MTNAVIWVEADPRTSHKANEALREGLAFAAAQIPVQFVLRGEATRVLTDDGSEFVDGEALEKSVKYFAKWKTPFHLPPGDPAVESGRALGQTVHESDAAAVAQVVAGADRFLRFT